MGESEESRQHGSEGGKEPQEGHQLEEGANQQLGTLGKDECLLAMPPADLDGSGNAVDAALEQPAIEPEPQEAAAADSAAGVFYLWLLACLLYTSPSPRDRQKSRMPSSA